MAGPDLQPPGHLRGVDERVRCEHERSEDGERGGLCRFAVRHREPDEREQPRQREPEEDEHTDAGGDHDRVGVGVEADEEPDEQHQEDDHGVADGVGQHPSPEHCGAGHRERAEPVDEPFALVFGEADRGVDGAERDGLHEDPRHQVVDVAAAGNGDGSAEHVPEHEDEDHGLHEGEHEELGDPADHGEVAPHHGAGVADGPPKAAVGSGCAKFCGGNGGSGHD